VTSPTTIVTINTGKGDGPYARRIELLAEGLAALAPEVVLLQESLVAQEIDAHTANTLADRLAMHVVYASARRKMREVEGVSVCSESGLAVLSRHQLRETTTIALPCDPADGERIALLAILQMDGASCLIANVHLSHLRGRDDLRRAQFEALLAHAWFRELHHVQLIGGDLNTPLNRLPELFGGTQQWTWRDASAVAGGPKPRATFPADAAPDIGACIDFILSVAPDGEAHPQFRGARVVLNCPDDAGIFPSDHRGVLVSMVVGEFGDMERVRS